MIARPKLATCSIAVRIIAFIPGLFLMLRGLAALWDDSYWIKPIQRFWFLPALSFLFGFICLTPWPGPLLNTRRARLTISVLIGIISVAFLYLHLFPFQYISTEAAENPRYQEEFSQAREAPLGSGFRTSRVVDGTTVWIVEKPHWSVWTVSSQLLLGFVPLSLYWLAAFSFMRRGPELGPTRAAIR